MNPEDKPYAKAESTYLHPDIDSKKKLIDWILIKLGSPSVTVELTQEQLDVCIADAITIYSKYATFDREDIILNACDYIPGRGFQLKDYNVACVSNICFDNSALGQLLGLGAQDVFFGTPAYLQNYAAGGMFPFFNNGRSAGLGWVSLHNLHENVELIGRMCGSMPQYRYNHITGFLKIIPEPRHASSGRVLIEAEIEPPPEILYGNEYVRRFALAYAKILLGTVRKKFQNVQLIGGGSVDTEIGQEGREELDKLMEQVRTDESFSGALFHIN